MSLTEAFILGLVQGITEFLPISSTAHVVITEHLLGLEFPGLIVEVHLHLASTLAVIVYFFRDLVEIAWGAFSFLTHRTEANRVRFRFALFVVLAAAITAGPGLLLQRLMGEVMKTAVFISGALMITGLFLIYIERIRHYGGRETAEMGVRDAVITGLGQTLAVLPGVSRSGATLMAALWSGLERETAVRYSFILVVPVTLGSMVLAAGEAGQALWTEIGTGPLIAALVSSFTFSLVGIVLLLDVLRKSRLVYLALYCFLAAAVIYTSMGPR